MSLGGVDYTACPFNGWFMNTEVSARAGTGVTGPSNLGGGTPGAVPTLSREGVCVRAWWLLFCLFYLPTFARV